MSAIIGGYCGGCDRKTYVSLGHPEWFDAWLYKGESSKQHKAYIELRNLKRCQKCAPEEWKRLLSVMLKKDPGPSSQSDSLYDDYVALKIATRKKKKGK